MLAVNEIMIKHIGGLIGYEMKTMIGKSGLETKIIEETAFGETI